jgi:heterotetrameric sarcosine oxidase gamma subunit
VTALAFLSPRSSQEGIVARTPTERLARAAGAGFERRAGWNVAVSYGDRLEREQARMTHTVGFADRSQLCKFELQASSEALAALIGEASDGLSLSAGRAARAQGAWWCPITPARALVLAEDAELLEPRLHAAAEHQGGTVTVLDLSCAFAALAVVGPGCRELLARLCAIDMRPSATPVAGFRPGSIARTPGFVLCEGADRLLLLVGWALGEYLWEVVADCAGQLGGGPVGADPLSARLDPEPSRQRGSADA